MSQFSWAYVYVAAALVPSALALVAITLYFRRVRSTLAAIWLASAAAGFAVAVASHVNAIFFATSPDAFMLRGRVLGYLGLGLGMATAVSFLLVMMRLLANPDSLRERSRNPELPSSVSTP